MASKTISAGAFMLILVLSCRDSLGDSYLEASQDEIRVGSFNVQIFGLTKLGKSDVVEVLCKIVLRYDVILIMEVRDITETVIPSFLKEVNRMAGSGISYDVVLSERLGRTSSKEQYAYLYRKDRVEIVDTYQYKDENDVFEREPYGVYVKALFNPAILGFFLLGVHIRPDDTFAEMNFVDDVYREASQYFGTSNSIIMGDFNADCSYLSETKFNNLDLVKDQQFLWLIDGKQDTTTRDSSCAYDRMVLAGDLIKYVPRKMVDIFRFDQAYGLSFEYTVDISDHYPLGLIVQSSVVSEEDHIQEYQDRLKRETEMAGGGLKVAAFNIQIFGVTKYSMEEVIGNLSRIVRRYDIVLIQEIRDSSETVIVNFLERVNRDASSDGVTYAIEVSQRLGRTTSKEQYAYMYRTDNVMILGTLQYNDSATDVFEREPFSAFVKSIKLDIPDFILIGLHSRPSDAEAEINHLVDVYEDASAQFGAGSALILGDLNADCSYLSRRRYESLRLVTDTRFTWLINSSVDTTSSSSDCAYDRFIVAGPIGGYISGNSVGVFQYDLAYSLSQEITEDISDHYPIECLIQGMLRMESRNSEVSPQATVPSSSSNHHLDFLSSFIATSSLLFSHNMMRNMMY